MIFTAKSFRGPTCIITPMKGPQTTFAVAVDEESKTITLSGFGALGGTPPVNYPLKYQVLQDGVIVVEGEVGIMVNGKMEPKQVRAVLRHMPEDGFLLKSRGFHWINEMPYNRAAPRGTPPPGLPPAPPTQ
jgi:hypothetical protein